MSGRRNVASQENYTSTKNSGKELSNQASGHATNGEHGDHTDSPADGQPTQFAIPQHDKVATAVPEAL